MKRAMILLVALFVAANLLVAATPQPAPKILPKVNPLPTALNADFQFRKTKLFELTVAELKVKKSFSQAVARDPNRNPAGGIAVAPLSFERTYRMYGAITNADRNQRYGNYFDFFWRVKRPAHVTIRLEYRQEKLRSFVQAREISYDYVKGTQKTEFAVIGDDYLNDGRVIAWRCLLIENGRIVAENRSFLWE
jgi:hypothetical protein